MATYTKPKPAGTPTWVDLMTPDADAARAFYRDLFGWEYDVGGPEYGGYTTARLGALPAAGIAGMAPGMPPMPPAWNLYFATDDIEADAARAVELGAAVAFAPMVVGEYGSMATLVDPTGAPFGFWQAGNHIGTQITEDAGSVAWFELYSPDAKRSRDFYAALLGATADPMPGGLEYYVLKQGEQMLAGIMQTDPAWGSFPPQWMTYFSVEDTDAALAQIAAGGGRALSEIDSSPFGRFAAVADPAGAQFKVIEPPRR